ncbi:MAG TPA: type II toxin-antitoxin system MqsA family antitoxin [Thermoanaerobaculia bacterium]|jgi:YgiT-type zinc finger domain-containing protein
MKCVICRNGETRPGNVTVTLERDGTTLIVRGVPAEVCENCGEEYVEDSAATRILQTAEEAARAGAHLDIREFAAA